MLCVVYCTIFIIISINYSLLQSTHSCLLLVFSIKLILVPTDPGFGSLPFSNSSCRWDLGAVRDFLFVDASECREPLVSPQ